MLGGVRAERIGKSWAKWYYYVIKNSFWSHVLYNFVSKWEDKSKDYQQVNCLRC